MLCSIIITTWNEIETVDEFIRRVESSFANTKYKYELIFVDDSSTDGSKERIIEHCKANKAVKLIVMSRRFGRNECFFAGFKHAKGDFGATLDSDLQDPPELIPVMLDVLCDKKVDVVYSVMKLRRGEHPFRLFLIGLGYRILKKFYNFNFPRNAGYLKVFSHRVIEEVNKTQDVEGYFKGLFGWVGFRQVAFEFERDGRFAGRTKYSFLTAMPYLDFLKSIISFSYTPIYFIMVFSVGLFVAVLIAAALGVVTRLEAVVIGASAWISLNIAMVGLYVLQIHANTRKRPAYVISEKYGLK